MSNAAPPAAGGLAFKAREIEELADIWFFRPLGMVFALAARALGLSPTAVTLIGTAVGVAGGAMLAWPEWAVVGFAVIILHSILDSSDGQLARMTGRSTEFGRMMDGLGGYITHIAIYIGILVSAFARGASPDIVLIAVLAGLSNVVHAQMYDYHRTTYASIAIKGVPTVVAAGGARAGVVALYERMERRLAGRHPDVERAVAARLVDGAIGADDRARYRACFYWPVRGWNFLGDNTRFYAIGVCAWLGRVEWFLLFELTFMNAALVALWLWQWRADRRFLMAL
ncbi:MAG: CDP-alcohol phosphatidyltransferase family protein [Acidobacteria bacterium]|nr:CDP-alcohol phosphatidyltransferase family protein [Acidobacteriota bacterium]